MKLLKVALLFSFIGGIMGLKCYTCTSGAGAATDTSACGDPFNPATTDPNVLELDCSTLGTGFDTCAKTTGTINGVSMDARSCYLSAGCPEQNGCASGSFGGASATVCCCNGDLCNGAGFLTVNIITTAAIFFAALIFTL